MNTGSSTHTPHITPLKVYLGVGSALLILTAVTVAISLVDLGGWNVVVALIVASVKALLVAFFFMHLFYDNKLYLVIFTTAIAFLMIFLILTMFDTAQRGRIYEIKDGPIRKNAVIYDKVVVDSSEVRDGVEPGESNDQH